MTDPKTTEPKRVWESWTAVRGAERKAMGLAEDDDAVGLAFSGGGIRSATFNLGVLQSLASLGILGRFHFLSTVSGGGYIGSWFVSWIARAKDGFPEVERDLANIAADHQQIRVLREYSNYLTPKKGLMSDDSWTALVTYVRNLLLNLLLLVPLLVAVVLFPHFLVAVSAEVQGWRPVPWSVQGWQIEPWSASLLLAFGLLALMHVFVVGNVAYFKRTRDGKTTSAEFPWFASASVVKRVAGTTALAASFFIATSLSTNAVISLERTILLGAIGYTAIFAVGLLLYHFTGPPDWRVRLYGLLLSAPVAGAVAGALVYCVHWAMTTVGSEGNRVLLGTFLVAISLIVASMIRAGVAGRSFDDNAREWWARLGAVMLRWAAMLAVLCAVVLDGPKALQTDVGAAAAAAAWLLSTGVGAFTATRQKSKSRVGEVASRLVGWLAPTIFVVGIVIGVAAATKTILSPGSRGLGGLFVLILASVGLSLVLSKWISVNEFSMHSFYRNRLVRAYLGASRRERRQHPFTGFDPDDDIGLAELCKRACSLGPQGERTCERMPAGPYPLINTTLNLVRGRRLAWQQRKAAAFLLSPMYCGFSLSSTENGSGQGGFRKTESLREPGAHQSRRNNKLSLGTALTISGAAVSPSMGFHSSRPLAFLMTLLNFRLGWWFGNPVKSNLTGPKWGLPRIIDELLSRASDEGDYVYLSDGGHFENLGLYELIRRRCRFIVVSDAAADPDLDFSDLGNAIRKCRTDFGVEIDIDVAPIKHAADARGWHGVVGTVRYPGERDGTLVYIKPTLTGDEPADVKHYAAKTSEFPHQSTVDQWFSEEQFESYRALGQHIAKTVFEVLGDGVDQSRLTNHQVFAHLRQHWRPPPPTNGSAFSRLSRELDGIWYELRHNPTLQFLNRQFYTEWPLLVDGADTPLKTEKKDGDPVTGQDPWLPSTEQERQAGIYFCQSMIQLMERVYVDLDLEKHADHPDNRGWINLFNHWVYSGMFRVTWAITASSYGARFQKFCEDEFHLSHGLNVVLSPRYPVDADVAISNDLKKDLTFLEEERLHNCLLVHRSLRQPATRTNLHAYVLKATLSDPYADARALDSPKFVFPLGFAVVDVRSSPPKSSEDPSKILYFRIQNHLRKAGLGREGMKRLCEPNGAGPGVSQVMGLRREAGALAALDGENPFNPKETLREWYDRHMGGRRSTKLRHLVESVVVERRAHAPCTENNLARYGP